MKFGRKRPSHGPRMRLCNYLRQSLPPAPASADYTQKASAALSNVYLNDQLGDCVIAGGYHVTGVETGNAIGVPFVASDAQILADYSAIGGYVPGDPSTDNGCDEVTALNYWCNAGFANGSRLLGWLAVDATNVAEVRSALDLFENLYFGIELPDEWVTPMPSGPGFTWDVAGAPNPDQGHCVMGVGYDAHGVQIDTWGMIGTITYEAIAKYCVQSAGGALYVLLSPDQLSKGQAKAPNGVAWADLIADFDSLGGHVPPPASPSPPPIPAPAGSVSLLQAQSWALQALAAAHPVLLRSQAQTIVSNALAAHWPKS